jgi:transposase
MSKARHLLDKAAQDELLQAYQGTKDGALRTRYQAVRLYGMGYVVAEILTITGCSVSRLRAWYAAYQRSGLTGLADRRVGGNHTYLRAAQVADLAERLRLYTPAQVVPQPATADGQFWTVPDLQRVVQQWYGVQYQSLTSYRTLFQRCRFSYQTSKGVYKSRNEQAVADFAAELEKKGAGLAAGASGECLPGH